MCLFIYWLLTGAFVALFVTVQEHFNLTVGVERL
jgi:hypothetical protein